MPPQRSQSLDSSQPPRLPLTQPSRVNRPGRVAGSQGYSVPNMCALVDANPQRLEAQLEDDGVGAPVDPSISGSMLQFLG
ncbi:hypothetical protein PtB15_17B39 [Puccinia triticina]|nr:hypothetical protein PtB15_17B39 [Puccinia triticina]